MAIEVKVQSVNKTKVSDLPCNTYFRVIEADELIYQNAVGLKYSQDGRSHLVLLTHPNASSASIEGVTSVEPLTSGLSITLELKR